VSFRTDVIPQHGYTRMTAFLVLSAANNRNKTLFLTMMMMMMMMTIAVIFDEVSDKAQKYV